MVLSITNINMDKKYSNLCCRCGKVRIVTKTWKETVGASEVTVTETVCPDPVCQKSLNKELESQKQKKALMEKKKEERILARKKGRKPNNKHN